MQFASLIDGWMMEFLRLGMSWVLPTLFVLSAIFCFRKARSFSRASLLGIGFLLEALTHLGNPNFIRAMDHTPLSMNEEMEKIIVFAQGILHFLASGILIIGLVRLFKQVERKVLLASSLGKYAILPGAEDLRPWQAGMDEINEAKH